MVEVTDEQFQEMINRAFAVLPKAHRQAIKNVAIIYADDPSPEQREKLNLQGYQTLFGLYEGVPLARRNGATNIYPPDKITLFKGPLCRAANTLDELQVELHHTVWHEVAHYFGLNHTQIHALEQ